MGHLPPAHEAHQLAHGPFCPNPAPYRMQPPPASYVPPLAAPCYAHCRLNLAASTPSGFLLPSTPSGFLLPGAPSGFLLTTATAGSQYAVVGSVVPEATCVFTDELLPKSDPDPPPPDLLPAAAAVLSKFLSLQPSPYAEFQGEETP
jgi:hypothetical protein